jgi:hypothetical protein
VNPCRRSSGQLSSEYRAPGVYSTLESVMTVTSKKGNLLFGPGRTGRTTVPFDAALVDPALLLRLLACPLDSSSSPCG